MPMHENDGRLLVKSYATPPFACISLDGEPRRGRIANRLRRRGCNPAESIGPCGPIMDRIKWHLKSPTKNYPAIWKA